MPKLDYLTISKLSARDIKRIFSKIEVDPVTDCWNWLGAQDRHGYGRIAFKGENCLIHRIIYAWLVAPLPKGVGRNILQLDHFVCDNKQCCNPWHVKLGSLRKNVLRNNNGVSSINFRKTHCINGHLLPPFDTERGRRRCRDCDERYRINNREAIRVRDTERRAKIRNQRLSGSLSKSS